MGGNYGDALLNITQPTGSYKTKTKVAETQAAKINGKFWSSSDHPDGGPQKIMTWWPGSQNGDGKTFDRNGIVCYYNQLATWDIILVHELIHAWRGVRGISSQKTVQGNEAAKEEEQMVVGLGPFKSEKYTENKFRALFKMAQRLDYPSLCISDDSIDNSSRDAALVDATSQVQPSTGYVLVDGPTISFVTDGKP